jgi:hypothetical protein
LCWRAGNTGSSSPSDVGTIAAAPAAWIIRGRVPDFRQPGERGWPQLGHSVSVVVDDVRAHHRHARAEGAMVLTGPTAQPWDLRTYAALDLEGHQWEFCERLAPVSLEAWGATLVQ